MSSQSGVTVAVIGASGNVGRKIIELLMMRKIVAPQHLQLYASKQSAGKKIKIGNDEWDLSSPDDIDFSTIQLAIFATDSDISKHHIATAIDNGVIVVDSSSLHRLDMDVPLIVSPVNKHLVDIQKHQLYAIANCVSSPIATVLAPMHRQYQIKRVIASTYQSTSGAGKGAMDELEHETQALLNGQLFQRHCFNKQIAFNVIPQIDRILEDGYTYEEFKIMREVQKILDSSFGMTATSVRVPVMVGHSVSLAVEFVNKIHLDDLHRILSDSDSVSVELEYKTPAEIVGSDQVHVGRLRIDPSIQNGIQLWICSDNLRRGAATDVVEVAEEIVNQLSHKVS